VIIHFSMKKLFIIFIISCIFSACNDGDIIVTEFDFEMTNLSNCGAPGGYTFFNINNSSAAESISLNLTTTDILFLESSVQEFQLNSSSNIVNYRKYNDDVSSNYFCSNIPPISPVVTLEFLGESGTAELTTIVSKLDNDGLEEDITSDLDTDNDNLLNYFDEDDDGDNVITIIELGLDYVNGVTENPQDTDGDGIYDYLDIDDDNDGVLTRYEDANGDLDPTNDETQEGDGPDYLNGSISNTNTIDQYRLHSYSFISDISLVLIDLVLISNDEEIIQETLNMGSQNNVINTTVTETPEF